MEDIGKNLAYRNLWTPGNLEGAMLNPCVHVCMRAPMDPQVSGWAGLLSLQKRKQR